MPRHVKDIDVLSNYLKGVMDRADHHAQDVNEVILSIAGGVVWRKDDDPLKVRTREGRMTNVLWFKVNRKQYALSYNHDTGEIEFRQDNIQGAVLASFSNRTTNAEIRTFFSGL